MSRAIQASASRPWIAIALVCLLAISISALFGTVINASVSGPVPPKQLFADSDLVVTGKVIRLNSQWGQGNQSGIITVVRFEVDGLAKGETSTEGIIEVGIPGGKVGNEEVWVEDQPTFTLGEHALLYLSYTGYASQDGYPRYTLTTGTFMGKSDATGNTTIGSDGKHVPISPLSSPLVTAPADPSTAATSTGVSSKMPDSQIIGVDVASDVYTYFPNVNATAKIGVTVKAYRQVNTIFFVLINGNDSNVSVHVSLAAGEEKTLNTSIELFGGRAIMLNPFATPSIHVDYVVGVGGIKRSVRVYAYPDYTYLFVGLGVLIVLASAFFIFRARRIPRALMYCI